ncbi:AI-2E family transporter [Frigidibacter sp. SD6-1]|uniref:AI-2E family transporter n=1 Tax=Frigidibacter sp. SD6-1 TaxID=3032581 RepID=UPI0024DFCC0C|nr:AI-2E family transporter [Frigidibacter sp. SD6-1]
MDDRNGPLPHTSAFGVGLALLATTAGALALWNLQGLALVVFAAILIAVPLAAAAGLVRRVLPVGQTIAVILTIVVFLVLFLGTIAAIGARTISEIAALSAEIPAAIDRLDSWIDLGSIETWIAARVQSSDGASSVLSGLSGMTSIVLGAASGVLLALAGGLFIAVDPACYRDGFLRLLPQRFRSKGGQVLDATGAALRAWLLGQVVSMFVVGTLTGIGLWLLGVPTAIGLGVVAGFFEFVPYVGPIASAVPAVLVALAESPTTALWVVLLYVGIQQVEGAFLIPLIQREAVNLPPAVTVFSVVAFGILFGFPGVVLAAPLTVVAMVILRQLWIPFIDAGRQRAWSRASLAGEV